MQNLVAAFCNSIRGIVSASRTERAVRQELVLLLVAIPAALLISPHRWMRVCLIGVILLTLAVELLNTALEKLCDHVTPHWHPAIGSIKDMGSAAVFCMLLLICIVWGTALLEYVHLKGAW
ncbi:diacylglycerol kinase [Microvirga aerilata]|uniref:Diacylglycerol kinase n=1 Tax=Microvirga aerilata TaxID=670292 RepID=A0A936ZCY7_9HYPH|nr:diacylglycerol kinase [Microvirga aerilata]MBL0408591.1 diacylglycerol kinase [Microvirga aerilata]